jgi:hypothetical protein
VDSFRRWSELSERQFSREHFVKDDTQRIDVRSMIDGRGPFDLLRCHVMRRPDDIFRAGQEHRVGIHLDELRDAEVGDLDPARFVQQEILGLDVAMNDPLVVRELERLANLRDDAQRLLGRQPSALLQLSQVRAVHELHHQVVQRSGHAIVVHADDVRMIQSREKAGFPRETLGEAGPCRRRRQDFRATSRSSAG